MRRSRIARLYLGGLLAAMALGQLVTWDTFTAAVADYGLAWPTATAAALWTGEVTAAAGLLTRRGLRPAAWIALVAAAAWTVLATQAFVRGLVVPNCGCFGAFLRQELRWWVLLEDAAFVALAAWVSIGMWRRTPPHLDTNGSETAP